MGSAFNAQDKTNPTLREGRIESRATNGEVRPLGLRVGRREYRGKEGEDPGTPKARMIEQEPVRNEWRSREEEKRRREKRQV